MSIPGSSGLTARQFTKILVRRALDNAVTDRAAQLAYYFLFALFPFLFFLVTLTAYLPLRGATDEMLGRIAQVMPRQAYEIIQGHLRDLLNNPRPKLLTLGIAVTLWSASSGVDALRASLNLSYDVKESRPFWRTRGTALVLTVLGSLGVLLAVTMIALGGKAGLWLASKVGMSQQYTLLWTFLRWPVTALVIITIAALLYYLLPDVKQQFRFITPGSLVGTVLWLVSTWGFTLYAEHFGSYNATYGSIGSVVVLMTWLYITGLVFILGGEINAILEHAAPDGKVRGARAEGEAPPPPEERPSIAAPGAAKSAASAERSRARVEQVRTTNGDRPLEDEHDGADPGRPDPDEPRQPLH
ncbi:MAG: YihY/virulence factor BrkB family protein [Myxococcales bacterium]